MYPCTIFKNIVCHDTKILKILKHCMYFGFYTYSLIINNYGCYKKYVRHCIYYSIYIVVNDVQVCILNFMSFGNILSYDYTNLILWEQEKQMREKSRFVRK